MGAEATKKNDARAAPMFLCGGVHAGRRVLHSMCHCHYRIRGHTCCEGKSNACGRVEERVAEASSAPGTLRRGVLPSRRPRGHSTRAREQSPRTVPGEGGRSNGPRSLSSGSICHGTMAFALRDHMRATCRTCAFASAQFYSPLTSTGRLMDAGHLAALGTPIRSAAYEIPFFYG